MHVVQETPALKATASKGNAKWWVGRVLTNGTDYYYTATEFWQTTADGSDSQHQVSAPFKVDPTNVGRANERGPKEQALFELEAMTKKQMDKGYAEPGKDQVRTYPLPMLAHKYEDKKHLVKWPAVAQFKFDGVRALYREGNGFWSRQGKPFLESVTAHLRFDTKGLTIDGELILDPEYGGFQSSISAVKKFDPKASPHLMYHVYDLMSETDMPYHSRRVVLENLLRQAPPGVRLVENFEAKSHEDLVKLHERFVEHGYEGAMVRLDGPYKAGHRSPDLLKYKAFDDAEFQVVDVLSGKGKDDGTALLVLKTETGGEFKARMLGPLAFRRKAFEDRALLIGKSATIRYQGLSEDGIPRFPRCVAIRDYE